MSERLPREWTLDWEPACVNPDAAESSVDFVLPGGYTHVYLFLRKTDEVYERWYVITFRNSYVHRCEEIYGYGRTLDDALRLAENTWKKETEYAMRALGISEDEFVNKFCRDCRERAGAVWMSVRVIGPGQIVRVPMRVVECMYCWDPFSMIYDKKDDILRMLDELSPTIQDLKRMGIQVT